MQECRDAALVAQLLARHRLSRFFTRMPEGFFLCRYERGEMLTGRYAPDRYLHFPVEGVIRIYSIRRDGSFYPVSQSSILSFLGDVELCGLPTQFMVEAVTPVTTLVLPLAENRVALLEDPEFLRCLNRALAEKLRLFAAFETNFTTVEKRLLDFMRTQCPNGALTSVEETTYRIRCSRRQLQRTLKELTRTGVLIRLGKGKYQLAEKAGREA